MSSTAEARSGSGRTRVTSRAALLVLMLTALILYLMVPLRTYMAQRSRLADLERQAQVLLAENEELRGDIARLNDPAFLERIARECLGMVREGEIAFIVVPKGGQAPPPKC